jgi:histidine kinase/DNA gyrase B/HSP90-like ATPase
MNQYTPVVKEAHAFREISLDFTTPAEIFRESIANSLDAYAKRVWLRASVEDRRGRETVFIDLCDDGTGLNENTIKAFLNLSDSIKAEGPPPGNAARRMTGYKGHGTKIYFNSEQLEVLSYDGESSPVFCRLSDPRGELAVGKVPSADIETLTLEMLKQRRTEWGFAT